ncbi:MAG: flagellin [Pseudomonadales bacterium]
MAQVINTNISSLNAQRNLDRSQGSLNTSLERLSSGLRINSAKDDAAGLAIVDRMTSQIRGLNQAVRNANDGISVAQTAEGALQEGSNILQRMRELAIQSSNDSNSANDRANIQKEVIQLQSELNRIAETTTFNGKNLLDGNFVTQQFQVGSNANETISVSIGSASANSIGADQIIGAATQDNVGAALAGAADATGGNGTAADTAFVITGGLGTSTLNLAADSTAASIAAQVNGATADTGVSASASTTTTISNVATGNISFELSSRDETGAAVGTASSVSAVITSSTDLTALRDAINAETARTGVTAALGAAGDTIDLSNTTGHDIGVADASDNDGAITAAVLDVGGETLADTAVAGAGTADSVVVGGKLQFNSSDSFLVQTTGTDILAATSTSSALSSVADVDLSSRQGSQDSLAVIDEALRFITDTRADLGAVQNRLDATISNLTNISENVSAARSRVQDADFASETANLTKNQILQQAGLSVLAQANAAPQSVLSLLQ